MACDCYIALPYGAVGKSTVCDCDISWSYSLDFSVWMNTGLDRTNTRKYVNVRKINVSQSNMLSFTSETCLYWI